MYVHTQDTVLYSTLCIECTFDTFEISQGLPTLTLEKLG